MSVQQVQQSFRAAVPQTSTERHHNAFSQVTALPVSFSIKPYDPVGLYRARMDNRDVVLRVLKGKLSRAEPNLTPRGGTAHCIAAGDKCVVVFLSS